MSDQPHLGFGTRLAYGFGAVAQGAKSNGFNYLLLFFYSQVVGLPAQWVSFAILIALVFDAVSDPLVGYFSDNLRSPWGRRHPFMYASALPVSLAYYFLWAPPEWSQEALLAYFLVLAIFIRTTITLYDIPSTALVAELTDDYVERSRIVGYRYFFGWWGGLTMAVLAYLVFLPEAKGVLLYTDGWRHYGLSASIIMFISIVVSSLGTHRHIPYLKAPSVQPNDEGFSVRRTARELRETLGNPSFLVLFAAALFFSALVALWLAPKVTQALGKKPAAITITAVAVALAPALFILRMLGLLPVNGTEALFWIVLTHGGIEVALIITSSILVGAMIADVVEDSEVHTGRRSEGTFFAANTFAQKAVNGLGVLVAGQLLAWVEFPTAAALGSVSEETIFSLATFYIPVEWGLYGFAIVMLALYRISRAGHEANLHTLRARRSLVSDGQTGEHTGASS